MKKLILILAIALIASPAFAALSVYLEREGTTNVVDVKYSGASTANLPRAFALAIKTNCQALIDDVNNFKLDGESTSGNPGYGIYPARVVIGTDGVVGSYGTPLADSADPGAGTGLDTNSVVLEFGSLYAGDVNAPAASGTLAKLYINVNGRTTNFTMTMVDEVTYRGGVVLEDGAQDLTAADGSMVYTMLVPPGAPTYTNPATNGATGIARAGINLTWTAGSDATGHDVYFGTASTPPEVSHNQPGLTYPTGAMVQGKLYYWQIVERNAAGTNAGPIWSFRVEECYKSTSLSYAAWQTFGRPSCWCFQRQCRGDADGIKTGLYWVTTPDLNLLKSAFNKNDATLLTIPNGICADFDHTKTGLYRVTTPDLNILKSYFNKSQTLVPVCDVATVNFWMN